jgi:hypothetical protein
MNSSPAIGSPCLTPDLILKVGPLKPLTIKFELKFFCNLSIVCKKLGPKPKLFNALRIKECQTL